MREKWGGKFIEQDHKSLPIEHPRKLQITGQKKMFAQDVGSLLLTGETRTLQETPGATNGRLS